MISVLFGIFLLFPIQEGFAEYKTRAENILTPEEILKFHVTDEILSLELKTKKPVRKRCFLLAVAQYKTKKAITNVNYNEKFKHQECQEKTEPTVITQTNQSLTWLSLYDNHRE